MSMYNKSHLLKCDRLCDPNIYPNYCYESSQISQILTIFTLDSVIILILGPIALCSAIFVIYTFYKYQETRKQAGQIILAISIAEFILVLHWVSMVIFDLSNGQGPESEDGFCQTEAIIGIIAGTMEFVYNCFFCISIIFIVQNALKKKPFPNKWVHLLSGIIVISVLIFCLASNSTGLSLFGMCSFKQKNNFAFFGIIIVMFYISLAGYTIFYFKRNVLDKYVSNKNQEGLSNEEIEFQKELKKMFNGLLNYYRLYIIFQTLIWTILAIANLIVGLNCTEWQQPGLNVFITIGNTCKLLTPVCLSFIRYKDPNIRERIRPILQQKLPCIFKPEKDNEKNLIENQDSSVNIQLSSENAYDKIQSILRVNQIYTMIAGIVAGQKLSQQEPVDDLADISEFDCKDKFEIKLKSNDVKQFDSLQLTTGSQVSLDDKTKMVMHAPKFFKTLIKQDQIMVDLEKSFNIDQNIDQIKTQFGGGDGGRSGSFFYLTYDNKMIVKSMTEEELNVLVKNLKIFCEHFQKNPKSLISKIYGIFTFSSGNNTEYILIMRNIQFVPSKYKLRTYDLKGSTVDRKVLKDSLSPEEREFTIKKKCMKDNDFEEVEKDGMVNIDPETAKEISDILTKDAEYFKLMQVMDYSLLIIKIDWELFCKDRNIENQQEFLQNNFTNNLFSIPSIHEQGVHYHISIIDYLQVWNAQKVTEQNFKKVKGLNITLDVSAKPPPQYAARFIQNIAQKLFIKQDDGKTKQ